MNSVVHPAKAVLVGTYATERMGQIIAGALESQGIPAALVRSGQEGAFPSLGLIPGAVGVFVALDSIDRARAVTEAIEGPALDA